MAHPRKPSYRCKNLLCKTSYSPFCHKFRCHGNGGRSGKMRLAAFNGPSLKTPLQAQKFRKNLLRKPSYSPFCPKFRCHGNGGRSGKMRLAAFDGPSPKNPYRRKNLLRKLSYSPFCPKFRCHGNGGRSGKNEIGSIRWPTPENLPIGAKISYARQVIAHFVTNFVAMATRVGPEKMRLAAFNGPSPKTPLQAQKFPKNLLRKPSYSPFCPKFCCHGNGGRSGKNAIGSIRWPIPEYFL